MAQTVISVENISKSYQLGVIGTRTFKGDLQRWWARQFGRPDPLRKVDEPDHGNRQGETIWALNNVSFQVQQGEVLGIIGRNGAGKSTLLKILSRVTTPTSGIVNIKGHIASLLEVGTGFHPDLTGRENIYLNGAIMGMSRVEVTRKFDEIVDFSGVEKFIDTPVKRYSSGMYVRLAFAVGAHLNPEILVVDEVLAVGDAEFQKKSLGKMSAVAQEGRTVLFVSHNLSAIQRLCPRTILLREGCLYHDGPTEDTVQAYISSGLLERPQYTQLPDKSKPMCLRKVFVLAHDGECRTDLPYDKPFRIVMEYDVNSPVKSAAVALSLRTLDEIRVFTTADYDANPTILGTRQPGTYRTEVTIPGEWLNPNRYKLIVFLSQESGGGNVYDTLETIAFRVVDTGTPYQRYGSSQRRAVLQPIFPWKTNRIDDEAV